MKCTFSNNLCKLSTGFNIVDIRAVLWIRIRIWIRIRSDPELFAGSGSGSGINSFGSGSGQPRFGMNLIPNFSVKK